MKDQITQLKKRGVRAEAVYSGMMRDDIIRVLDNAVLGAYKLLYISPERLSSELFLAKLERMRQVSLIVVDEAHCVSQWGYDFRPSYLQIAKARHVIPYHVPVLALTATATPKVVDDIQERLEFREKNVFSMSFERKNLIYVVRHTSDRVGEMLHILQSVTEGSAIVYVRTRQQTSELAKYFNEQGITALSYHAGLTNAEKDIRQANWASNRVRVMVATNAFGMGIDKPDVRMVIHYSMPDSIEAYFQEAGRAGRDGKPSYAVLLFNPSDTSTLTRRVRETYPEVEYIKQTYENVCYFLQIGVGESFGKTYYFPMEHFCRQFRQFPVQANSALTLLNNAGYIEYHEEQEFKSALHFILTKAELYRIHNTDKDMELLQQTILRCYSGVFAGFVYIEETLLAHQTGLTTERVYQLLKEMHHSRVIDFIPHRKTPTITFTIARVDTEQVGMPASVYLDRKTDLENRITQMINYASSQSECRSVLLLRYFGEQNVVPCGQCDVCLAMRKQGQMFKSAIADVRKQIMEFIADGEPHLLAALRKHLTANTEVVSATLRAMLEEEEVVVNGAKIMMNNK